MDFGVVLQTNPPADRLLELTKIAESNGFTHVWTFDSHVLWQEPFVLYTRMLTETDNVVVGPMVTNPGTRDWTVLASMFATLNDMFGNRTICGMGRGDSALRYIGKRPRTLAGMIDCMRVIKGLVAGQEVEYDERKISIPWIKSGWDLPMWGAGYGPLALDAIGRNADGFILQLADPQILDWTLQTVRTAASDEKRHPDDVSVCVAAPAYVGENLPHQREQLRWFGGMVGNHVYDLVKRYGTDQPDLVHPVLAEYIKARDAYDYAHHGRAGNPSTDFVSDEIVDRFCVLGTVEGHLAKLEHLHESGVTQFSIYLMHDDQEATMEAYGRHIIPRFS